MELTETDMRRSPRCSRKAPRRKLGKAAAKPAHFKLSGKSKEKVLVFILLHAKRATITRWTAADRPQVLSRAAAVLAVAEATRLDQWTFASFFSNFSWKRLKIILIMHSLRFKGQIFGFFSSRRNVNGRLQQLSSVDTPGAAAAAAKPVLSVSCRIKRIISENKFCFRN